ncbi:hypothetical protein KR018_004225, partial [Drosophila ironensis]
YHRKLHPMRRILKGLFLISVLAGTAPVSILSSCRSRKHRLLHLAWIVFWYGSFVFASYWEFVLVTLQRVALDRYLNAVESVIYVIHMASILALTCQWRNSIPNVLESIICSDSERGYVVDCRRSRRFIRIQLLLVWAFSCLAFAVDIWSQKCVIFRAFLSISSYVMPNVISNLSFVQYYMLLQEIAWRQRKVTDSLERELCHLLVPRRAQIQKFRMQHAELMYFTRLVNQSYQYSIVLLFMGCFLNFNLVLFLLFQGIDNPGLADEPKWLYMLLWLAMHIGKVVSILFFNQKVLNEQSRCLDMLNGIPNPGTELQETINHFILQLQIDLRQHVVGGVMVLDLKFLTTLLVASADFFIFLLQYDVTYEALAKSVQSNITK